MSKWLVSGLYYDEHNYVVLAYLRKTIGHLPFDIFFAQDSDELKGIVETISSMNIRYKDYEVFEELSSTSSK